MSESLTYQHRPLRQIFHHPLFTSLRQFLHAVIQAFIATSALFTAVFLLICFFTKSSISRNIQGVGDLLALHAHAPHATAVLFFGLMGWLLAICYILIALRWISIRFLGRAPDRFETFMNAMGLAFFSFLAVIVFTTHDSPSQSMTLVSKPHSSLPMPPAPRDRVLLQIGDHDVRGIAQIRDMGQGRYEVIMSK